MRRADIGRCRLVGAAAARAARFLGLPYTHEERASIGLSLVCYDADNGYGGGIGRATSRAAKRDWDAVIADVLSHLDGADICEARNREMRQAMRAAQKAS